MTNEKMTKIEQIIMKCLELAKSPNANEAMAAVKKAQELMVKYNIQVENLKNSPAKKIGAGITESYGKSYRFRLAKIIADNYAVKNYYLGKMKVVFYGHETNVQTAVKVYDYLHNMIHRLADSHQTKVWKQTRNTRGVYNSYVNGFLDGLKSQLDEQCRALALVVTDDVEEAYKEYSKDFTSFKCKGMQNAKILADYEAGFKKGQEVANNNSAQIEAGK